MLTRIIGWWLGLDRVATVDRVRPALGGEWATHGSGPFWFCLSLLLILALVVWFYMRYQGTGSRRTRVVLAVIRSLLLMLLLVTLAEPVLRITITRFEPPELFFVFDGTASMGLRDQYEADQRKALAESTGLRGFMSGAAPSRQESVAAWLTHNSSEAGTEGLLARIQQPGACELQVFLFDGQTAGRLREINGTADWDGPPDWHEVARQLSTGGQTTDLGGTLRQLARRANKDRLAGVIMVSDFVHNSGEHPLSRTTPALASPVDDLSIPLHTICVGARQSRDIAVQLQPDAKIRRGEKTVIGVRIQQTQLLGEMVHVRLVAITPEPPDQPDAAKEIATRDVTLASDTQLLEFPFFPERAGEMQLSVEVSPVEGEVVTENNRAMRRIQVIDDFIRLLYVAYEPTWEWRFIKEVFHRDPAVGMRGFRTYLASSDPRVRQSNPLFLPTLTQSPQDFFANDVVFLDDLPQASLSPSFCSMLERFVRDLGGGLVVIAGPRFGPQQLADTALAKMLPVIIDPNSRLDDRSEFALQLTARAGEFPFMQLDEDAEENQRAWDNLAHLPWYQPVANKHERAIVLAQHPRDKCLDGSTPQPLIAIRRYGAGEVVYLGFNEMWRLRRLYGEKYYRRFWLPMIDRLGLSHALGARKRFVVRTDRAQYRVEDEVVLSVQAYDDNYQPLAPTELETQSLEAQLVRLEAGSQPEETRSLRIGAIRPGLFETAFAVPQEGRYQIQVTDPVTNRRAQRDLEVVGVSAELRVSVCNDLLAEQLARASGGTSCALHRADVLAEQIDLSPIPQVEEHSYAIWNTPMWFALVVPLMLGEWLLRKWIHLV